MTKIDEKLHSACVNGDLKQVRNLLHKKKYFLFGAARVSINAKDQYGIQTSLHYAVSNNHEKVAELLLDYGADVNAKSSDSQTPLHYAARNNFEEVAELLLSRGASVDAKSNLGRTPLHEAAIGDSRGVAELVLKHGARINERDYGGQTPLDLAISHSGKSSFGRKVAALLFKSGAQAKNTTLSQFLDIAIRLDDAELAELLMKQGVDVNLKNYSGDTPLHDALSQKSRKVAELLLSHGADVDATTNQGTTPLHQAARNNYKEVAELLLMNGADVNANTSNGSTPLHWAANSKEVAGLLLMHGADVNANTSKGSTPLHRAAFANSKEVAGLLLMHGADVDAKDDDGDTPLCVCHKSKDVAELLLKLKGESVVEPLMLRLEDSSGWIRFKTARILAMIGDLRALDPIFKYLLLSNEQHKIEFSSASMEFDETVNGYLGIFSDCRNDNRREQKERGEGYYSWSTYSYGLEIAEAAIAKLVTIRNPISNNLLNLLLEVKDVKVPTMSSANEGAFIPLSTLSFSTIREKAKEELHRRGNPAYDSTAFLDKNSWKE